MPLTSKKLSAAPNVLIRALQGELVLLNLDTESYFGLDEVGTRMWAVLTEAPTLGEAFTSLMSEFDVDPRELEEDLVDFVESLTGAGLVELHDVPVR
jgi:hypothetical protein